VIAGRLTTTFQFGVGDGHIGEETLDWADPAPWVMPEGLAGLLWVGNQLPFPPDLAAQRPRRYPGADRADGALGPILMIFRAAWPDRHSGGAGVVRSGAVRSWPIQKSQAKVRAKRPVLNMTGHSTQAGNGAGVASCASIAKEVSMVMTNSGQIHTTRSRAVGREALWRRGTAMLALKGSTRYIHRLHPAWRKLSEKIALLVVPTTRTR
jgi:hypothetical protein